MQESKTEIQMNINQKGGLFSNKTLYFGIKNYKDLDNLDEAIELLSGITMKSLYKLIFDWSQEKNKGLFSGTRKARLKLEAFKKFIDKNNNTGEQEMINEEMLNKKKYRQKHLSRILLGMLYTYLIQSSLDQTNIDMFSKEVHKVISPKDFVNVKSVKGSKEYKNEKTRKKETDAKVIELVKKYILTDGNNFLNKKVIIKELYRLITQGLAADARRNEALIAKRSAASAVKRRENENEIAKARIIESELSGAPQVALEKTELNKVIQEIRNRFNLINNNIRDIYTSIKNLTGSQEDPATIKAVYKIIEDINTIIQKATELKQFLSGPLFQRLNIKYETDIAAAIDSLSFFDLEQWQLKPGHIGPLGPLPLIKFIQYIDDLVKSLTFKRKELQAKYLANPFASPNTYGLTQDQRTKLAGDDNMTHHTRQLQSPGEIQNLDQALRKPDKSTLIEPEKDGLKFLNDNEDDQALGKLLRVFCSLNFGQLKYLRKLLNLSNVNNFFLDILVNKMKADRVLDTFIPVCETIFTDIIKILTENIGVYQLETLEKQKEILTQVKKLNVLDATNGQILTFIGNMNTSIADARRVADEQKALTQAQDDAAASALAAQTAADEVNAFLETANKAVERARGDYKTQGFAEAAAEAANEAQRAATFARGAADEAAGTTDPATAQRAADRAREAAAHARVSADEAKRAADNAKRAADNAQRAAEREAVERRAAEQRAAAERSAAERALQAERLLDAQEAARLREEQQQRLIVSTPNYPKKSKQMGEDPTIQRQVLGSEEQPFEQEAPSLAAMIAKRNKNIQNKQAATEKAEQQQARLLVKTPEYPKTQTQIFGSEAQTQSRQELGELTQSEAKFIFQAPEAGSSKSQTSQRQSTKNLSRTETLAAGQGQGPSQSGKLEELSPEIGSSKLQTSQELSLKPNSGATAKNAAQAVEMQKAQGRPFAEKPTFGSSLNRVLEFERLNPVEMHFALKSPQISERSEESEQEQISRLKQEQISRLMRNAMLSETRQAREIQKEITSLSLEHDKEILKRNMLMSALKKNDPAINLQYKQAFNLTLPELLVESNTIISNMQETIQKLRTELEAAEKAAAEEQSFVKREKQPSFFEPLPSFSETQPVAAPLAYGQQRQGRGAKTTTFKKEPQFATSSRLAQRLGEPFVSSHNSAELSSQIQALRNLPILQDTKAGSNSSTKPVEKRETEQPAPPQSATRPKAPREQSRQASPQSVVAAAETNPPADTQAKQSVVAAPAPSASVNSAKLAPKLQSEEAAATNLSPSAPSSAPSASTNPATPPREAPSAARPRAPGQASRVAAAKPAAQSAARPKAPEQSLQVSREGSAKAEPPGQASRVAAANLSPSAEQQRAQEQERRATGSNVSAKQAQKLAQEALEAEELGSEMQGLFAEKKPPAAAPPPSEVGSAAAEALAADTRAQQAVVALKQRQNPELRQESIELEEVNTAAEQALAAAAEAAAPSAAETNPPQPQPPPAAEGNPDSSAGGGSRSKSSRKRVHRLSGKNKKRNMKSAHKTTKKHKKHIRKQTRTR
jgi:hypothetical protein